MNHPMPARGRGRLVALVTAVTLLAAPLAVVPATAAAPTAAAATSATSVTIKKIGTKTAPYKKKATVKPRVTRKGKVAVKSKTLTVAQHGKHIAKNKKKVALKAGTYRVRTNVTYRTYTIKASTGAKVWSKDKVKTKAQKLVVKQGKKPSRTSPISTKSCPTWAPIKGNRTTAKKGDWIYHVPGGRYYKATAPEECFTTAAAARKAGYRASQNG